MFSADVHSRKFRLLSYPAERFVDGCFDSMDSTKGRSVIPLSFVSTSSGHDECRNGTSNGGFQEDPRGSPSFQETPETDRQVGPPRLLGAEVLYWDMILL